MINKKNLAVTVMFTFLLLASFSFVLAQPAGSGGADLSAGTPVAGPTWLLNLAEFLRLGGAVGSTITWQELFVGLAIMFMIFAFVYEALGFTPFQKEWTKILFSVGLAIIIAITGGVSYMSNELVELLRDSIVLAILACVLLAVFFMVAGTWFRGRIQAAKANAKIGMIKSGYGAMGAGDAARAKAAFDMAKAVEKI